MTVASQAEQSGWIVVRLGAAKAGLIERIPSVVEQAYETYESLPDADPTTEVHTAARLGGGPVPFGVERAVVRRAKPPDFGLKSLAQHAEAEGTAVLVLLDELQHYVGDDLRSFFSDIQQVTKIGRLPLGFLGAGLTEMRHTLLSDEAMTFVQRCARLEVPPLSPSDVSRGLLRTINDAGGSIDDDALQVLIEASGSLPYRMQLAGYHAWQAAAAPSYPINRAAAEQELGISSSRMNRAVEQAVDAGCVAEHADGTLRIERLMTVEDVLVLATKDQDLRAVRDSELSAGEAEARANLRIAAARALLELNSRCGAWMPRAKAPCALPAGHSGRCRTAPRT